MEYFTIFIGVTIIILLIYLIFKDNPVNSLVNQIIEERKEIEELRQRIEKERIDLSSRSEFLSGRIKRLMGIKVGDIGIIVNFPLVNGQGTKNEFKYEVDYEVEILMVTEDKCKVRALSFRTSNSKINSDLAGNTPSILSIIDDRWVSREKIELIIDDRVRRDIKLDEILDGGKN